MKNKKKTGEKRLVLENEVLLLVNIFWRNSLIQLSFCRILFLHVFFYFFILYAHFVRSFCRILFLHVFHFFPHFVCFSFSVLQSHKIRNIVNHAATLIFILIFSSCFIVKLSYLHIQYISFYKNNVGNILFPQDWN